MRQEYLESNTGKCFPIDLVEARKSENDNAVDDVVIATMQKIFTENNDINRISWIQEKIGTGHWNGRICMILDRR